MKAAMSELPRGHVYFLMMRKPADSGHDFGLVKIGVTWGDVLHRVAKLQTGNPFDLVCFDSFETPWPRQVEHFLHRTHAVDMQQPEWLKCSRDDLDLLVRRAKDAARQIEERKLKELPFLTQQSNGQTRRATSAEFDVHAKCRKVLKELVPAQLRLTAADSRLKAATGGTLGIPGIVTVKYVPATIRFSARLAAARFPELAAQCTTPRVGGIFRWRKVPRPFHFPAENRTVLEQVQAAKTAADNVLLANGRPTGWMQRTAELENWHQEFLQATRDVHRLEADLAVLRTDLILGIGEYEALDPVCSFKRDVISKIDRPAFCENYRDEAEQCAEYVAPKLRKNVYTSRSYL
jgi:Meiotically up-regulated gene 113